MSKRPIRYAIRVLVVLSAACAETRDSDGPSISVEAPWVRPVTVVEVGTASDTTDHMAAMHGSTNSAAYLTIRNEGNAPDRLLGASTEAARVTELHRTVIDADGMAHMQAVEALEIAAGSEVALEPGSYHLMLFDVRQTLEEGDSAGLILRFEVSGELEVRSSIRAFEE